MKWKKQVINFAKKNREKNIANYSAICNTIIHIIYIDNTPGE